MVTLSEFSRLVSAIHDAAVTPEHWVDTMSAVRQCMDATTGAVITADASGRMAKSASIAPEAYRPYSEYYRRVDYVLEAVEQGPVGLILDGRSLIEINAHSEFNVDWMLPFGMHDGLFVRLTKEPPVTSFLVAAPRGDGPFVNAERAELVTALIPHFQQALRTEKHVQGLERDAARPRRSHRQHAAGGTRRRHQQFCAALQYDCINAPAPRRRIECAVRPALRIPAGCGRCTAACGVRRAGDG